MIKTVLLLLICLSISVVSFSQSNQEKAQTLVQKYLADHSKYNSTTDPKFSNITVLKSSYADTKNYKNFQHKIDSLKLEGRKIDAKIPKLKTTLEIDQAKKDSKSLSNQLVATSDQLINFMTEYKGMQIGWTIKTTNPSTKKLRTFYIDRELTRVTAVR